MPYSVGLHCAATAFLSAGFATQFTLAVIAFLAIVLITSSLQKEGADAPQVSAWFLTLSHHSLLPSTLRLFKLGVPGYWSERISVSTAKSMSYFNDHLESQTYGTSF